MVAYPSSATVFTILFADLDQPNLTSMNPEGLAKFMLGIIALAKQLQEHASAVNSNDLLAVSSQNGAASLIALYSVRLHDLVPGTCQPSLVVLASHFLVSLYLSYSRGIVIGAHF